jgi:hypothetical protein
VRPSTGVECFYPPACLKLVSLALLNLSVLCVVSCNALEDHTLALVTVHCHGCTAVVQVVVEHEVYKTTFYSVVFNGGT